MAFVNCFDVVSMVVEEAANRFSPIYDLNEDKYKFLKDYCSVIDDIFKEFDGEYYDVEVDEITMKVSIAFGCDLITITSSKHRLYEIMRHACSVEFCEKNGKIEVRLVFPSLWDRS